MGDSVYLPSSGRVAEREVCFDVGVFEETSFADIRLEYWNSAMHCNGRELKLANGR